MQQMGKRGEQDHFSPSATPNPDDAAASCTVRRVTTDFEQHEKLEIPLVEMLKNGMIANENSYLAELFKLEE